MIDYNKHCKMNFGEYVKIHEFQDKSTGTARTIISLVWRTTGNYQVGYYFYSLSTGRTINLNRCTPLPMPDYVIIHIHALAQNDPTGITSNNRNENEMEEDYDGDDYVPSDR